MPKNVNITVLIAPLDWGLGHATRCIPIIHELLKLHCNVIIATDGKQHDLLKSEFPDLTFVQLPGYDVRYSNKKRLFSLKIIQQIPKLIGSIKRENKWLTQFIADNNITAVISDNRYGFFHTSAQSIFITHQLTIKTPFPLLEKLLQKINYRYISHFAECWVPDEPGDNNLAGELSHPAVMPPIPIKYLGVLSRFSSTASASKSYKLLIVLSGPEPQRTILEHLLLQQLNETKGKVMFVRGLPGNQQTLSSTENITFYNHLTATELERAFLQCEYVISRCGYTTVMDICALKVKSILIPTPGQTEQEYLSAHLQQHNFCIAVQQSNFNLAQVLSRAEKFPYRFPSLKTDSYVQVITSFVDDLSKRRQSL